MAVSPQNTLKRELATVKRLDGISDHPNADRLSIGRVGGWDVVVSKDCTTETVGVFFEVDSIIPAHVMGEVTKPMTVKTRKIRGILSQGLFLPLDEIRKEVNLQALAVGDDVTDLLQVGQVKVVDEDVNPAWFKSGTRGFHDICPTGVNKTQEQRLQSSMWLLDRVAGKPYYISLKYDGSSATYVMDNGAFTVCSRNLEAGEGSAYRRAAEKYDLEGKAEGRRLVLQGEVYGPGVNGNKHETTVLQLAVFNVYDIEAGTYLDLDSMLAKLQELGVPAVEILESGDSFSHDLTSLLKLARGRYVGTRNHREGLVVRRKDQSCSFKVLNNEYLLKYEA